MMREPRLIVKNSFGRIVLDLRLDHLLRCEFMNGNAVCYHDTELRFQISETRENKPHAVFEQTYAREDFPNYGNDV